MIRMFAVIIYFILLKYMILTPLLRPLHFALITFFTIFLVYSFPCFFKVSESIYYFDLTKYHFTIFVILYQLLLYFYCITFARLYGVFYGIALLLNFICRRCRGRTSILIYWFLTKYFTVLYWISQICFRKTVLSGINNITYHVKLLFTYISLMSLLRTLSQCFIIMFYHFFWSFFLRYIAVLMSLKDFISLP